MTKRSLKIHFIIIGILLAVIIIFYSLEHIPFGFSIRQNEPILLASSDSSGSMSLIRIYQYKYNKLRQTQDIEIYFSVENENDPMGWTGQSFDFTIQNQSTPLAEEDFEFQCDSNKSTVTIHTSNQETQTLSFSLPQ